MEKEYNTPEYRYSLELHFSHQWTTNWSRYRIQVFIWLYFLVTLTQIQQYCLDFNELPGIWVQSLEIHFCSRKIKNVGCCLFSPKHIHLPYKHQLNLKHKCWDVIVPLNLQHHATTDSPTASPFWRMNNWLFSPHAIHFTFTYLQILLLVHAYIKVGSVELLLGQEMPLGCTGQRQLQ